MFWCIFWGFFASQSWAGLLCLQAPMGSIHCPVLSRPLLYQRPLLLTSTPQKAERFKGPTSPSGKCGREAIPRPSGGLHHPRQPHGRVLQTDAFLQRDLTVSGLVSLKKRGLFLLILKGPSGSKSIATAREEKIEPIKIKHCSPYIVIVVTCYNNRTPHRFCQSWIC